MTDILLKTCLIATILHTQQNYKKKDSTVLLLFKSMLVFNSDLIGGVKKEAVGTSDRITISPIEDTEG